MALLKKEEILHLRGVDGKLLPQKIILELVSTKDNIVEIEALPITKGEMNEITKKIEANNGQTTEDMDLEIIEKYVVTPKITGKELMESGKVNYVNAIVIAIISLSTGKTQKELIENKKNKSEKSDFLS